MSDRPTDPVHGLEVRHGAAAGDGALDAGVGATLPVGFRLQTEGRRMRLISTARPKTKWFFTMFAGFWNLVTFPFVVGAFLNGSYEIVLFLGLHLAVGVGMAYAALRAWINDVHFLVDERGLRVEHRPLPWLKKEIAASDVAQLFDELDTSYKVNNRPIPQWKVGVRLKSGKEIVLLSGLPERAQAEAIERHIEQFLGIVDDGR